MFVQIIKAKATDPDGLRRQFDHWGERLRPGAVGFLGSTSGATTDGEFVAVVRFESEEAARRNSDRTEQGEWWEATAACLENVTFADTSDVTTWGRGGSDDAGFVQVIEGQVSDRARFEEIQKEFDATVAEVRPEVIGGTLAWQAGSRLTLTAYFTSVAEARAGEAKEPPPDQKALDEEWHSLLSDVRYYDLTEPIILSG